MFKRIKYLIRVLAIYFHDTTAYYVVPVDLFSRISQNNTNKDELQKIQRELRDLKTLYPFEREFIRAEAVVERMLILER